MFSRNLTKIIPFQISFSLNPTIKEKFSDVQRAVKQSATFLFVFLKGRFGNIRNFSLASGNGFLGKSFNTKKIIKYLLLFLILAAFLLLGKRIFDYLNSSKNGQKLKVMGATATQYINREFTFPLKDGKGEQISEIKYAVERVEQRDEIIVKGQKATAVSGRTFLIISLKVTNVFNQTIQLNTKDYIRLSVNGNEEEWLAPDIHNDPVEVQAISTKYTRVGFPVNTSDKNLVLRIGEINGDKEKIELNLK